MLEMLKRKKQALARGENVKKLAEGQNRLRILPVPVTGSPVLKPEDEGQFWLEYGVHYVRPSMDPNEKPVVFGNSLLIDGELSPIETMIGKAISSAKTDEEIKFFTGMKATKRILVQALNRTAGSPDASEAPAVYELTPTTWEAVLGLMVEYAEEHGNIFDPATGIDIIIERKGKNLDTKYAVLPAFGNKNKPVPKEALAKAVNLYDFVKAQFFRTGDDVKLMAALSSATGMAPAALPSPTASALLSAPAAAVDAAANAKRIAAEAARKAAEKAELEALVESATIEAEEPAVEAEDDAEAQLKAQLKALQAKKAAAAKPVKPVAAKPAAPAPVDDFNGDLSMEDLESQLGEI